jgi:uncharacterized protein YjbI with pentapeptide repeats
VEAQRLLLRKSALQSTQRRWPRPMYKRILIILKVAGPIVAFLGVAAGLYQYREGLRERAASDSRAEYIRATQLLSQKGPADPIAGIASLTQLAENNAERTWLMTEALSAFVRYTAPRSDAYPSQSDRWPPAPYKDPPCKGRPPSAIYDYAACSILQPFNQRNPAVTAALNALGNRDPRNETKANVPRHFKSQLDASNKVGPSGETAARKSNLDTINDFWWRKNRNDSRELLLQLQGAVLTSFPDILSRPWLNLSHSSLVRSELDAPFLEGVNFRRSDLSFSKLASAKLAKADFSGSWLVGVDLYEADLRGSTLEYADVRGAELGRTNLQKAWMSAGLFFRANFWEADLSGAYLVASDMRDLETMAGARLDDVLAYRADFSNALIAGSLGEVVCMRRAFLKEAIFRGADLSGVDLQSSEMQDADLTMTVLRGADLRGVVLDGANLEGADLSRSDLRGVDLTKVHGTPARIAGALVNDLRALPPLWPTKLTEQVIVKPQPSSLAAVECRTDERTAQQRAALSSQ